MDYEFVMKSRAARETFAHRIELVRMSRAAQEWAIEKFGPMTTSDRVENDDSTRDPFFDWHYVFSDRGTWANVSGDFYFRDADQAFEFKMRWG